MSKLKPVTLTKYDSCLSYVLKRTGLWKQFKKTTIYSLTVDPSFKRVDVDKPKRGDIVVYFDNTYPTKYAPVSIDKNGNVLYDSVVTTGHVLLFEGKNIVSDVFIDSDGYPCIRKRKMSELSTPDYLIRLIS